MAKREYQQPSVLRQEGSRPYWYVRYRVREFNKETKRFKRKEKWQQLGYCEEITKRQAERKRDTILARVNNQVLRLPGYMLLRDFVEIYKERHVKTLAPGARGKYLSALKNHLVPVFGEFSLCEISTEDVQAFLNAKTEEGFSYWTRNDFKGILSGIFTKASDWGYWSGKNPTLRTSIGPMSTARKKYRLSDGQIQALLEELPWPVDLMCATVLSTGMRVSELCGLRWGSVDLARGYIEVQETYYRGETGGTKTRNSHRELSLGALTAAFDALRPAGARPTDYVFETDGEPMDDREILQHIIRPVAERLGFYHPGFGWRTFRRMHLTGVHEGQEGLNLFEVMQQAGHTKPETTLQYTLLSSDRRERAVVGLQKRWLPARCAGIVRDCGNAREA